MRSIEEMVEAGGWKSTSAFWSWLRGALRRSLWKKHPIKLNHLKANRMRMPLGKKTKRNLDGMVWSCICEQCGKYFPQTQCEVDHVLQSGSLLKVSDILPFIQRMVFITAADLKIMCKPCHGTKTLAEKRGITFEEATVEKEIIAFTKLPVAKQKEQLLELGCNANEITSKDKRRKAYEKICKAV